MRPQHHRRIGTGSGSRNGPYPRGRLPRSLLTDTSNSIVDLGVNIMAILLGLLAALLYGGADFGGGLAARRAGSLTVNLVGSIASTLLIWVVLAVTPSGTATLPALLWGLLAGLGGGAGTLVLYRGLARGRMSVVGPVSAVGSAAVPVLAGLALGEHTGLLATAGVLLALPAIALVAATGGNTRGALRTGLLDGLLAGAAFGLMFVALAQAGTHHGLWPVAAEQTSSLLVVVIAAVAARAPLGLTVRTACTPVLVGIAGMAATVSYYYATRFGMVATVAILTSLYPGVTVLLARVVLRERFSMVQRLGLGLCAVAVLAIAVN